MTHPKDIGPTHCTTCLDSGEVSVPRDLPRPIAEKRPPWHAGGGKFKPCPDCKATVNVISDNLTEQPQVTKKRRGRPRKFPQV